MSQVSRRPEEAAAQADQASRELLRQMGVVQPVIQRPEVSGAEADRIAVESADRMARPRAQQLLEYAERLNNLLISGQSLTEGIVEREVVRILGPSQGDWSAEIGYIDHAARTTVEARGRGESTVAEVNAASVRIGLNALAESYVLDNRLAAVQAPDEVREGARSIVGDRMRAASLEGMAQAASGEQQQALMTASRLFHARAALVASAATMRISHNATLSGEANAQAREFVEGIVTTLSEGARADTRERTLECNRFDQRAATGLMQQLGSLRQQLEGAQSAGFDAASLELAGRSDQLQLMHGTVRDENLRRSLEGLRRDLERMQRRLEEQERVSEDEMAEAELQIAYAASAQEILGDRTGAQVAGQEAILGRGMSALRLAADLRAMRMAMAGRRLSAQDAARGVLGADATEEQVNALVAAFTQAGERVQEREQELKRQASLQLFIAREFDASGSQRDRRGLLGLSAGLSDGSRTMEEVAQQLGERMASRLGGFTDRRRGDRIQDAGIRDILDRIAARLGEGTPTVDDLTRASETVRLARGVQREERALREGRFRGIRGQALGMLRRALRAMELGAPVEVAQTQFDLARRYRRAVRDRGLRELISGMSDRLSFAVNLRAMDAMVNHPEEASRISAAEAARRLLEAERPGEEISDEEVARLVTRFERAGAPGEEAATREQRDAFIQAIERQAMAFDQLMERRDAVRRLQGRAPGPGERSAHQVALDAINSILGRLSRGEEVSQPDIDRAQGQAIMLSGERNETLIASVFVNSRDPEARQGQLDAVRGLQAMQQVLRRLSGRRRENAAGIYRRGMEALSEGRFDDALAFFSFAQAYATSAVAADRRIMLQLATRLGNAGLGEERIAALPEEERPIPAEQAGWLARAYLDRAVSQAAITDRRLRDTFTSYSELAIRAYQSGDTAGAGTLRHMARMIARAAPLSRREEAVSTVLALASGDEERGIPSLDALRQGLAGESPRRVAQTLGATSEEQERSLLRVLDLTLDELQVGVSEVEFNARQARVDTRTARSRYTSEAARLRGLLRSAERAGDSAGVERLRRQMGIADIGRTRERLDRAHEHHVAGADLLRRAIARSREAVRATDEAEGRRLRAEASEMFMRGRMLMESAEGLQSATLTVHRSVTTVFTGRRSVRGRVPADRAGEQFSRVGEEVSEAERLEPGALQRHRVVLGRASEGLRLGVLRVEQQRALQRSAWQLIRRGETLTEENRANHDQYGDVTLPLPPGEEGPGELAYDQETVQAEIDRGVRRARALDIRGASHSLGVAETEMRAGVQAAIISERHRAFMQGASEAEQREGLQYYITFNWFRMLDYAREQARAGNMHEASSTLEYVREEATVGGRQQELHNGVSAERRTEEDAQSRARAFERWRDDQVYRREGEAYAATLKQSQDQQEYMRMRQSHREAEIELREEAAREGREVDQDALRRLERRHRAAERSFLSTHESTGRPPDLAAVRAYDENATALQNAGGFEAMAAEARRQAAAAGARARELEDARDSVVDVDDVPGGRGEDYPAQMVAALARVTEEREAERSGRPTTLADIGYTPPPVEALQARVGRAADYRRRAREAGGAERRRLLRQAAEEDGAVLRYFNRHQEDLGDVTGYLSDRGHMRESVASGLVAMAAHGRGQIGYQEHSAGWSIALGGADRFMEDTAATDQLARSRRFGIAEGTVRRRLDYATSRFLQCHLYAAHNSGRVRRDIIEEQTISLPTIGGGASGTGLVVRRAGDIYEARILRREGEQLTFAAAWRDGTRRTMEALHTLSQGLGEAPEPETAEQREFQRQVGEHAYRLMVMHHPTSVAISDMDMRVTFATWGIDIDPRTDRARELVLSPGEQSALMVAAQAIASSRGQVLNISANLRTFASTDEGRRALGSLETLMGAIGRQIQPIVDRGLARRDGVYDDPMSANELNGITAEISRMSTATDRAVAQHIREGVSDDKIVLYTEIGGKVVAMGIMAATGYGLPAAIVGFVDTMAQLEEQRIAIGGVEQMTGLERGLRTGSIIMAGAGVVAAGSTTILGAVSSEVVAGSRLLSGMARANQIMGYGLIIGGIGLGAGEITNMALYGGSDVGWGDYLFAGLNAASPLVQIGLAQVGTMRPSLMHGTNFTAGLYRSIMFVMGTSTREIRHQQRMALEQRVASLQIGRTRTMTRTWARALGSGEAPVGVSRSDFAAARRAVAQRMRGGMSRSRAIREVAAEHGGRQADTDRLQIARIERTLGRSLDDNERASLLEHYRDTVGQPTLIDAEDAVSLIRGMDGLVESRVGQLPDQAQTAFRLIEEAIGRRLEPGEALAILDHYGDNIPFTVRTVRERGRTREVIVPDAGRIMGQLHNIQQRRRLLTLSDYAAMREQAEGAALIAEREGARPEAPAPETVLARLEAVSRTRDLEVSRARLQGEVDGMRVTVPGGGEEARYNLPGQPDMQYPRAQVDAALEIAVAADFFINHGVLPEGTPADVGRAAQMLAGTALRPTDFRRAVHAGDARAQMAHALAQAESMPQFIEAPMRRSSRGALPREAELRDLSAADRQAASTSADRLASAYAEFTRGELTQQRREALRLTGEEMSLFQDMQRRGLTGSEAGAEIATFAAAQTREMNMARALVQELWPMISSLPESERIPILRRARRLARAMHDFNEAYLRSTTDEQRARAVAQVRQRHDLTTEEFGYVSAVAAQDVHEIAAGVASAAVTGRMPAVEAPVSRARPAAPRERPAAAPVVRRRPRPTPATRRGTAEDVDAAFQRPEPALRISAELEASAGEEMLHGRTLRSGTRRADARDQASNQESWHNGEILRHVEDVARSIVERNFRAWMSALESGTRPDGMGREEFAAVQGRVAALEQQGVPRREAIWRVAHREASFDAVVVALDKSGLGDFDATTARRLGTREGRSPADVISRELFEHMINRAARLLREQGNPIAADALLGAGKCDERALVAIGRGLDGEAVMRALRQVRDEVNAQVNPELHAAMARDGREVPLVPDEYVAEVREARNMLRDLDLQRRQQAEQEARPYDPVSRTDEDRVLTRIARRRLGAGASEEDVNAEVQRLRGYYETPDLRTYEVEMGPRRMTMLDWVDTYDIRHPDIIGNFAADHREVRVAPGMRPGALTRAYAEAEAAGAAHTPRVARALGMEEGRPGLDEMPNVMRPIDTGEVDIQGMRTTTAEDGSIVIQEGDTVQVYFRLTDGGREAAELSLAGYLSEITHDGTVAMSERSLAALTGYIGRVRDDGSIAVRPRITEILGRFAAEFSEADMARIGRIMESTGASMDVAIALSRAVDSPAAAESVAALQGAGRLMQGMGVNPREALQLTNYADILGRVPLELFAEVVTRKGYNFARGDIGFSEGNTFISHDGMNVLAQAAVDTLFNATGSTAADGARSSTARAMGNLSWLVPSGTDAGSMVTHVNRLLQEAGVVGIEAGVRVVETRDGRISGMRYVRPHADRSRAAAGEVSATSVPTGPRPESSMRQVEAALAGMGMDQPARLPASTFQDASFIVHMTHAYQREGAARGPLMYALFGERGVEVYRTCSGYEGTPVEIYQRLSGVDTRAGRRAVNDFMIFRLVREIRDRRTLRRFRDVESWLQGRIRYAESRGNETEARYYTAMRDAYRTFARTEGAAAVQRFADYEGTGRLPTPPGGGRGRPGEIPRIMGRSGARRTTIPPARGMEEGEAARGPTPEQAALARRLGRGPRELAEFARDVVRAEGAERARLLGQLHEDIQALVEPLTRDGAFARAASRSDEEFDSHVSTFGARRLRELANDIRRETTAFSSPEELASFARDYYLNQEGRQPNPEIVHRYATLTDEERGAVDVLLRNLRFQRNARVGGRDFDGYVSGQTSREGSVLSRAYRRANPEPEAAEAAEAAMPRAVGGEEFEVRGPAVERPEAERRPGEVVGIRRGPEVRAAQGAEVPGRAAAPAAAAAAAAPAERAAPRAPAPGGPRARPPPAERTLITRDLGLDAAVLRERGIAYDGTTGADAAGRTFHRLIYTDERGTRHSMDLDGRLSGMDLLRAVDTEVHRITTRELENLETMGGRTSGRAELEAVLGRSASGEANQRARWLARRLDQLALRGPQDLNEINPQYREAVRAIRAGDNDPGLVLRQAEMLLDWRSSPFSTREARELVALERGRAGRDATASERMVIDGLGGDLEYQDALQTGNRRVMIQVAEEYARLAAAAERITAPPAEVQAAAVRLRGAYQRDPEVRAGMDEAARSAGLSIDEHIQNVARNEVIMVRARASERSGGFHTVLDGRSASSAGNTVTFSDPQDIRQRRAVLDRRYRDDAEFRASVDSRARTSLARDRMFDRMARDQARRTIPESEYDEAVRVASLAEDVALGRTRLADVPEADRALVRRMSEHEGFREATLRESRQTVEEEIAGQRVTRAVTVRRPDRAEQLAIALNPAERLPPPPARPVMEERIRVMNLYSSHRRGQTEGFSPMDRVAMEMIDRLVSGGAEADDAIISVIRITRRAARYATTRIAGDETDRMIIDMIDARSARREVSRDVIAFEVVRDMLGQSDRIRALRGRPEEGTDAYAYDMAHGRARDAGREAPNDEDFFFGALARERMLAMDSQLFSVTARGSILSDAPATEAAHVDVDIATGGETRYRVRVFRDRVEVVGASSEAIGTSIWTGAGAREAFLRYANSRLGRRLAGSLADVMEQVRHDNLGEASRIADSIAAGEPRPTRLTLTHEEAAQQLMNPNAPNRAELLRHFTSISPREQDLILTQMRRMLRAVRREARDHVDAHREAEGLAANRRASGMQDRISYLQELWELNGVAGSRIERRFGLRPGQLSELYMQRGTREAARSAVGSRLGITDTDYVNDHIWGMLLSGELISVVRDMYPDATSVQMTDIGGGATGAYMLTVTDAAGVHHEFVKSVDMRADLMGAVQLRVAGVPSPTVLTAWRGRPLHYMRADGRASNYGISRSIAAFEGPVRVGGRDVPLRARTAVSFDNLDSSPELMNLWLTNPDMFWDRVGYSFAAQFEAGALDGHGGNTFGTIVEVTDLTPENLAAMARAGFERMPDSERHEYFMPGRIDTDDAAGAYWAEGHSGNYSFERYNQRMGGIVYTMLFTRLARARNMYEARQCGAYRYEVPAAQLDAYRQRYGIIESGGRYYIETYNPSFARELLGAGLSEVARPSRQPTFVTPRDLMREAFGRRGDGPFYRGMRTWARVHGADEGFQQAMIANLRAWEGNPVGVSSFRLSRDHLSQLGSDGVTYQWFPFNGEGQMPAFSSDGRGTMMPEYERIPGITGIDAANPWPQEVVALFPHNHAVFVVPHTEGMGGMLGVFDSGGRSFAVFSQSRLPPELRASAVRATRHHGSIRAGVGFGAMTGIGTERLGAIPVFEHITAMGEQGIVGIFRDIQLRAEATEGGAARVLGRPDDANGIRRFLRDRLPPGFGPEAWPPRRRR